MLRPRGHWEPSKTPPASSGDRIAALVVAAGIGVAGLYGVVTSELARLEFAREAVRATATVLEYRCPPRYDCTGPNNRDWLEVAFPTDSGTREERIDADHPREKGSLVEIRFVRDEPNGLVALAGQDPPRSWIPFALLATGGLGTIVVWRTRPKA